MTSSSHQSPSSPSPKLWHRMPKRYWPQQRELKTRRSKQRKLDSCFFGYLTGLLITRSNTMCVWQLHPYCCCCCCGMFGSPLASPNFDIGGFHSILDIFCGHRLLLRKVRQLSRLQRARRPQPKRQIRRSRRISNPRMWNPQRKRLREPEKPRRRRRVPLRVQLGRRRPILLPKRNLLRSPCLIRFHTRIPTANEEFDKVVQPNPN